MTRQLVFIGDSLTQWFDWQKRFADYQVTNLGLSGEPVEGLLGRREIIRSRIDDPTFIFLMTGINNIAMEQYEIISPYREIVRNFTTWYKKSNVVVQSILPVDLAWVANDTIRNTNRRLEEVAREYDAEYLDLFSLFLDSKGNPRRDFLQDDGVHLSSKGYEVWANSVEGFLNQRPSNIG